MYEQIFKPIKINGLELANRTVRSATAEGMADQSGNPLASLTEMFVKLATENIGLIIAGHSFISPSGRASSFQTALDHDDRIRPWRNLLNAVHAENGKIFAQLAHAGGNAADRQTAVGPSPFAQSQDKAPCHELSAQEIARLVELYAQSAYRAKKAGFDGVQIHAAHGYLISEFLSPVYNKRTDSYGGSCENRARFLCEILSAMRHETGRAFPIIAKINTEDFAHGGFTSEECVLVCKKLEELSLDAVELSGGLPISENDLTPVRKSAPDTQNAAVYYETAARKIKSALTIPVILVGGIRWPDTAEHLIRDNICDMISLSRPLIREPELVKNWQKGFATKAKCVSCNLCFRPAVTGRGIYCVKDK